jgi:hypothetical protein
LKSRDGQPALVVGQFDYRATPFQNVLRQSVVSVTEAPACVLTKAKQIIVDLGILYDAKLLHVLLDVISL